MDEIAGDAWELLPKFDALCILTNGHVRPSGQAVMGKGIAWEAAQRFPELPEVLGDLIRRNGNVVQVLRDSNPCLISFPTKPAEKKYPCGVVGGLSWKFKPGDTVPGWACKSETPTIRWSARVLVPLADDLGLKMVLLPRPGCGNGGLKWEEEVRPILAQHLDDRFYIVTHGLECDADGQRLLRLE